MKQIQTWLKRSKKKTNSKTKPWKFRRQAVKAQKERTTQKKNAKEKQIGRYKTLNYFLSNVVIFLAKYKPLQLCKKMKVLKNNNKHTLGERAIKFWLQLFFKKIST